jgi:hypothetical protein
MRLLALLAIAALAAACRSGASPAVDGAGHRASRPPCPPEAPAPPVLPHFHPWHGVPEFWLARAGAAETLLADAGAIAAHNQKLRELSEEGWPSGRWELDDRRLDPARAKEHLRSRLDKLAAGVKQGTRVTARGEPARTLLETLRARALQLQPADEIRVAHRSTPLRCFPTDEAVYERAWDLSFDLMQCAQLRFGEPARVLGRTDGGYLYVWSRYAEGWVRAEALTPPLAAAAARAFLEPARFAVVQVDRLPLHADASPTSRLVGVAGFGLRLPLADAGPAPADGAENEAPLALRVPTRAGLTAGWVLRRGAVSIGYPPLSRRNLVERAFRLLHSPYGWGGTGDARDCSRLMMDIFAAFGVELPRNTWHQSQAGTRRVEVGGMGEHDKAAAIEAAARRAAVLLYMPGHIMLYLGRDGDLLYALHLFSGYLTPCSGGGETMQRVNRTVVTSLELGVRGSRRSFLQRITRLVLISGRQSTP